MLAFDGVDDFMTLPITPAVTGFNLAFWFVKRNHTSNARIIDWQEGGPAKGFSLLEGSGLPDVQVTTHNGAETARLTSLRPIANLYHLAITHNGTEMRTYINGVLSGTGGSPTGVDSTAPFTVPTATLTVGKRATGATNYWNGKMGELVFHSTATPWTQAQITDLYYNGVIPSGASYWLFDGNVLDGSGNGNHGTLTGGTYIYQGTPRLSSRFMGGSTLFNGSTSVVQVTNQPIYNLVNYSVSFWMNATEQVDDRYIVGNGNSLTTTPMWGINYKKPAGSSYNLRIFIRDDSNNVLSGAGDITPQNLAHGRWYHVVITDAGGSLKCYINGVYQGITLTYTRGTLTLDQTSFGALWRTFVVNNWKGLLAKAEIFNQVLTEKQAADLYFSGNAGVRPIASYALDDQPSTYVDSISANNGTGTATTYSPDTPVQQRTVVSNDTASLLFGAAVGDKVEMASIGGTVGDTWSTIIRAKYKSGSYGNTVEARVWNKGTELVRTTTTGGLAVTIDATSANGIIGFFKFDNKWHDYGVTHDGSTVKGYRDGLLIGSFALVDTATDVASVFTVGNRSSGSRSIDGWVKSFVHYKNTVLSASEIMNAYFSRTFPSGSSINLAINEGAGTTAYDTSGNGNNGTITGATWSTNTPSKARVVATSRTAV